MRCSCRHPRRWPHALPALALGAIAAACGGGSAGSFAGASHVPNSQPGWEQWQTAADPAAPLDEAKGGRTARGTPITKRVAECFPAETRNVFSQVDMVAGADGKLHPFDYTDGHAVTPKGRDAIRGQNTWLLWGEGNEAFWGWLQEDGYGLIDFLILLDSRSRGTRFARAGLLSQPGLKSNSTRNLLGLYLDQADGERVKLQQPPTDIDPATGQLQTPPRRAHRPMPLFKPGDPELYRKVLAALPQDGVDPAVYGYPSGIVGLRLMPNPDFFGATDAAGTARRYWDERVVRARNDAYYDPASGIASDPDLVRPFRVSMSCAFCHIAPHPLNPPPDPENPQWANMSSTIGNQYWKPQQAFANLTDEPSFLFQFLNSQQRGTIDTSLVSTDQINNPNTMNAIFDVPARLQRAMVNVPEHQSAANLLMPAIEDPPGTNPRHTPRVLLDGADSIGVFGALARVYLNIGTFPEEWFRCHNPIIGFKPQRPFAIATLDQKSVYWQAGQKYRIPYLAAFFTYRSVQQAPHPREIITAPMKLATAPGGAEELAAEAPLAAQGRAVFLRNCALCHSSKQPQEGFQLHFSRDWAGRAASSPGQPVDLTLPYDFRDWERFKRSAPYLDYVQRIERLAGAPAGGKDLFVEDNFLGNEVRIPITLVGTNSGRAVGTNGMRGQVWDNYSSDDYKALPAVGHVRFYNPYSGEGVDEWGNNDSYDPPGGGPGYYRPASLISLWATAPYLHNNTLGVFTGDPSVRGRLRAFDDGIDKLFYKARRVAGPEHAPGDLRWEHPALARRDPGFIYRTTVPTRIHFAGKFIHPILAGVLGPFWTGALTLYLWLLLALVLAVLAVFGRPRHAAFVLLLLAIALAAVLVVARLDRVYPLLWLLPALAAGGAILLWLGKPRPRAARVVLASLAVVALLLGALLSLFVHGRLGPLDPGPIPQGVPVNLVMNFNPEAPLGAKIEAGAALLRGILLVRKGHLTGTRALAVFEHEAGRPLLAVSKCPDFVLDRGHWFAESLSDEEKRQLKAFLKTL
jgi:hypothetical protein